MPKLIDINTWSKEIHLHTTGTREKVIVTSPKGEKYYFKTSYKREKKDYKFEFWSEIIASKIGLLLKFNVVQYDIAFYNNVIGCISKSIIDEDDQEHHEGYRYIVERYPDFKLNFKKDHSFQKITSSLIKSHLGHCINDVLNMIVFDSLIGNTDRHSENWALVVNAKAINNVFISFNNLPIWRRWIMNLGMYVRNRHTIKSIVKIYRKNFYKFSPLYDNGSSLGRELTEQQIEEIRSDQDKLLKFLNKGKPDIRWNEKKLNHFDLIEVIKYEYKLEIEVIVARVKEYYSKNKLIEIISNIDRKIPDKFVDYKLSQSRKDFLIKSIDLRVKTLLEL